MKMYWSYLRILFKSIAQYRLSFWLLAVGQSLTPLTGFAGIYFMFERFGQLRDWQFYEVALCFAVVHLSYTLCEAFARGFDTFSTLVVNGGFDRLLVRPRSTLVQVLGSRFEFARVGRISFSLILLFWAIGNLDIAWTAAKVVTLLLMIVSGMAIVAGIYIVTASLCFWTVEGLEIANIFTDGGREMAQYPLNIYGKWVKVFFTYVIPYGCVNYLPLLYILDRTQGSGWLYMLTPLVGVVFLLPCLLIWRFGVKHYCSTGS
ncbi:MAG: rane protein [Paenibacillaceae bacterium]|jgi:ABC-2 type transport system permease protein|nr:rane protein [Paenibacillaceae bacterium]